jgi:hypothetical protein
MILWLQCRHPSVWGGLSLRRPTVCLLTLRIPPTRRDTHRYWRHSRGRSKPAPQKDRFFVLGAGFNQSHVRAKPDRYSVFFGCPTPACVSHAVRRASSTAYHNRPAPVTSYCHCSIRTPSISRHPSSPRSGCCRSERDRGFEVIDRHASYVGPGACLQRSSHPSTASCE